MVFGNQQRFIGQQWLRRTLQRHKINKKSRLRYSLLFYN